MNPPHWELKPALRALFKIPSAPPPLLSHPEAWSALFPPFLASCLFKEADERLSAAQLLELPFCVAAGSAEQIREALRPLAEEKLAALPSPRRTAEAERRDGDSRSGGIGATLGLGGTVGKAGGTIGTMDTIGTFGTFGTMAAGAAEERPRTLVQVGAGVGGGHTLVRTLRGGLAALGLGVDGAERADEGTLRPGKAAHLAHTLLLSEDADGSKWSADEGTLRLGVTAHNTTHNAAGGGTLRYDAAALGTAGDAYADTGRGGYLTNTLRLSEDVDGAKWSADEGTLRPGAAGLTITTGDDCDDTERGSRLTCTLRLSEVEPLREAMALEAKREADAAIAGPAAPQPAKSDHAGPPQQESGSPVPTRLLAQESGSPVLTRLSARAPRDLEPVFSSPSNILLGAVEGAEAAGAAVVRWASERLEAVAGSGGVAVLMVAAGSEATAGSGDAAGLLDAAGPASSVNAAGPSVGGGSLNAASSVDTAGAGDAASSLDVAGPGASTGAVGTGGLGTGGEGHGREGTDGGGEGGGGKGGGKGGEGGEGGCGGDGGGDKGGGGKGDGGGVAGGSGLEVHFAQTLRLSETRRSAEGGAPSSGPPPGSPDLTRDRSYAQGEGGAPSSVAPPGSPDLTRGRSFAQGSGAVGAPSSIAPPASPDLIRGRSFAKGSIEGGAPSVFPGSPDLIRGRSYAQVLMEGGARGTLDEAADGPQLAEPLGDEDCVRLVMCTLRMPPWDGSTPFESVPLEGAPMTPWLVGLCELVAEGGPPTLLVLLLRMLTDARSAADGARRAPAAPVPRAPAAAGGGRRRSSGRGVGGTAGAARGGPGRGPAGGPAGDALSAAFQAELRVQRVVLKALLIVARAAPSSSIFRSEALQETLFGLALTHDAEVRLLAVQVLRELADADEGAARFMCSPGALQGVVALCGSAIHAPTPSQHGASSLLCTLELLETLLSSVVQAGQEARAALPTGLGAMLATVEGQTERGSATNKLARNLRAHLGLGEGSPGLDLLGRRVSFGDAMGGWLNRAFPSPGGANKSA